MGPKYTWTGGQTFGYLNALIRSAIDERPITMRGFITPSDDKYLRFKSAFGDWSGHEIDLLLDLWTGRSWNRELLVQPKKSSTTVSAKLNRSLSKVEDVLHPAKTVSDPVAILYSVSHDIWTMTNRRHLLRSGSYGTVCVTNTFSPTF